MRSIGKHAGALLLALLLSSIVFWPIRLLQSAHDPCRDFPGEAKGATRFCEAIELQPNPIQLAIFRIKFAWKQLPAGPALWLLALGGRIILIATGLIGIALFRHRKPFAALVSTYILIVGLLSTISFATKAVFNFDLFGFLPILFYWVPPIRIFYFFLFGALL